MYVKVARDEVGEIVVREGQGWAYRVYGGLGKGAGVNVSYTELGSREAEKAFRSKNIKTHNIIGLREECR